MYILNRVSDEIKEEPKPEISEAELALEVRKYLFSMKYKTCLQQNPFL